MKNNYQLLFAYSHKIITNDKFPNFYFSALFSNSSLLNNKVNNNNNNFNIFNDQYIYPEFDSDSENISYSNKKYLIILSLKIIILIRIMNFRSLNLIRKNLIDYSLVVIKVI